MNIDSAGEKSNNHINMAVEVRNGRSPTGPDVARASRRVVAEHMFRTRNATVVRFAESLVGPNDAQDLAQDVWLSTCNGIGEITGPAAFLDRSIRNRANTELRRRTSRETRGVAPGAVDVSVLYEATTVYAGDTSHVDTSRRAEGKENLKVVLEGITQLPERQQEVLRRLIRGVPEADIATELGIKVQTVKTHAGKARRTLAALIEG